MQDNSIQDTEYDYEDINLEFASNIDQLNVIIMRGELTGSNLIADFYPSVKLDGKKYRTHAILVDVMEESD